MEYMGLLFFMVLVVFILILLASCVKIVPQAHALVIERLGLSLIHI